MARRGGAVFPADQSIARVRVIVDNVALRKEIARNTVGARSKPSARNRTLLEAVRRELDRIAKGWRLRHNNFRNSRFRILPVPVLGKLSKVHGLRTLVVRQPRTAELHQFRFGDVRVRFPHDKALGASHHFSSGPESPRPRTGRVRDQHFLDFERQKCSRRR